MRRSSVPPWIVAAVGLALCAVCAAASDSSFRHNPEVEVFIRQLAAGHQFNPRELRRLFEQVKIQTSVLRAVSRPVTARPWYEYRATQLTEARIRSGVDYWQRHADTLVRASAEYGVPEEIIVATIGLETFYGRNTGTSNVFAALATLAFAYPPRAELFRGELEQFLLLARELNIHPSRRKGSYAGALGIAQFLPSSYRRDAIDFDGDGKRDLWSHGDAIGSVANYYSRYGWQNGQPILLSIERDPERAGDEFVRLLERGLAPHATVAMVRNSGAIPTGPVALDMLVSVFGAEDQAGMRYWMGFNNFYVITRYNRSINYALAVYELAQELRRARDGNSIK